MSISSSISSTRAGLLEGHPGLEIMQSPEDEDVERVKKEKMLKHKVDWRLCTIAGLLCSLNLLDSGIISSALVTSMQQDLGLDQGNRYSVAVLIFTVSSVCFQLPATIAVRLLGPRVFFALVTVALGLITMVCGVIFTQF